MNTFEWENGTIIERPYVEIDGVKHYVEDGEVSGGTPVTANNLNEMQAILGGNFQLKGKLLWTNPNPNEQFSTQSITLSSDDYDVLEIYYYDWVDTTSYKDLLCQKTIKGHSTKLQVQLSHNSNGYAGNRRIRYIDNTTLQVDDCYRIIDNSAFSNAKANYWNVPVYIVGYKTGLFE